MRSLAPCLLLVACGTIGLDKGDDTGSMDDTGELPALRIDSLDPDWGPLDGGTAVTVTGAGYEGTVGFSFGGTAVDVAWVDATQIVVTTPEVMGEATVDVTVTSDLGSYTLPDAFTFSNSAPADDTGGDDTGGSATGLVGGLVEFDYLVIACPECFGLTSVLTVEALAAFHEPVYGSWVDWLPPVGSCEIDPVMANPTDDLLDVGTHAYLEYSSSVSLDLQRSVDSTGTWYAATGLEQSDYVKNASFDLTVSDGGDLGPFSAEGALHTTSGFDDLTPLNLYEAGSSAFAPFSASAATFTWSPTGVGDAVVVDMIVFDSTGAIQLGEILCVASDSGSLTIPSSAFSNYYAGDLAAVYFYRWQTSEGVRSSDGATIEATTAFGILGTATLVP